MLKVTYLCKQNMYATVCVQEYSGTNKEEIAEDVRISMYSDEVKWHDNEGIKEVDMVKELKREHV